VAQVPPPTRRASQAQLASSFLSVTGKAKAFSEKVEPVFRFKNAPNVLRASRKTDN